MEPVQCDLTSRNCVPCHGGTPPLPAEKIGAMMAQVDGWQLVEATKIVKAYKFKDFISALAFVNRVGELAEREGHHPDIFLSWGKVRVELTTHAAKGLTENDFIVAAKIDSLPRG